MAMIYLPLSHGNIRAPVSTTVNFSDATPSGAGFVTGTVSRRLADVLYRHVEFRGRHTRLDWEAIDFSVRGWKDYHLPPEITEVLRSVHWSSSGLVSFRKIEHVNIQEARGVKCVLKHRAAEGWRRERLLVGSRRPRSLG